MLKPDLPQGVTEGAISLMIGHPDSSTLSTPEFQDAAARVLAAPNAYRTLEYGPDQGPPALVEYLTDKFSRDEVAIQPEQLMIVAGATHGVDLVARRHALRGGVVIVEAPSYADSIHTFRDHGLDLYSVPIDDQGIIPDALEAVFKRLPNTPRLLYTIPTFHNPMGVTVPTARRLDILRLARQYDVAIVEDDPYRDLSFDEAAPPSFFALADGHPVIHIGTFSKTLAPGLRVGWLIGSAEDIQWFADCGTAQMGGGASPFPAYIVAEYCRCGYWEPHIADLRNVYRMRRDTMLAALERHMPAGVRWTRPGGGFFIWLTLPPQVYARDIKQRAKERGVLVASGEGYFLTPADGEHALRLAYSFAAPEDIDTAIGILADVISS